MSERDPNSNRSPKFTARFSTREFELAHGHKPRGRGGWAFVFTYGGQPLGEMWWFVGLYGAAKKAALVEARMRGANVVEVQS